MRRLSLGVFPRLAGAGEGVGKCQVVPRSAGSAPRDDHPSVGDGEELRLCAAVPGHTAEVATELFQELLWAYGPSGQEDAVRDICRRELQPVVDESCLRPAPGVASACGWIVRLRRLRAGAKIGRGRTFATRLFLRDVVVADTVLTGTIEVGGVAQTEFLRRSDDWRGE